MDDEAKDYAEQDTEEVILSRAGKIKQWFEIAMATRKVAMLAWGLIVATGGSFVVGQVTDTKPIRDAAVAVGLIDESVPHETTGHNHDALLDEMMNLQVEVGQLQEEMTQHGHPLPEGIAGIAGIAGPRGPQGVAGVAGVAGPPGKDGAASVDALRAEIEKLLPANHKSLH